jgi:hypothetical protein
MFDVDKNKMKQPISAPTQAGIAIKIGALPFAVEYCLLNCETKNCNPLVRKGIAVFCK